MPSDRQFLLQRSASPSIQQPLSRPSSGSTKRSRKRRSSQKSTSSGSSTDSAAAAHPIPASSPRILQRPGSAAAEARAPDFDLHMHQRPASALDVRTFDELDDIFSECSNEHSGLHSNPVLASAANQRGRSFREFFRNISNKNAGYRVLPKNRSDQMDRPQSAPPVDNENSAHNGRSAPYHGPSLSARAATGHSASRGHDPRRGRYGRVEIPPFRPGPEWQASLGQGSNGGERRPPLPDTSSDEETSTP